MALTRFPDQRDHRILGVSHAKDDFVVARRNALSSVSGENSSTPLVPGKRFRSSLMT
ncbi:hypothetical protein [Sinorhizobium numidicum]|uniref:hypothetical protein n=1 Tax=Sinorhizobium numidicum TaxID=680248 RepID=UPI003CC8BC05